jgi:hypothetical protein
VRAFHEQLVLRSTLEDASVCGCLVCAMEDSGRPSSSFKTRDSHESRRIHQAHPSPETTRQSEASSLQRHFRVTLLDRSPAQDPVVRWVVFGDGIHSRRLSIFSTECMAVLGSLTWVSWRVVHDTESSARTISNPLLELCLTSISSDSTKPYHPRRLQIQSQLCSMSAKCRLRSC